MFRQLSNWERNGNLKRAHDCINVSINIDFNGAR